MNILVIPSWYPSKKNKIAGSFFKEQAFALGEDNNVFVLYINMYSMKTGIQEHNFKTSITKKGSVTEIIFNVPSFGIGCVSYSLYMSIWRFLLLYHYERYIKKKKIDIIQAHSFAPGGTAACLIGEMYHIPVVITEHISGVHQKHLGKRQIEELRNVYEKSKIFICVSKDLANSVSYYIGEYYNKIQVVPNCVNQIFLDTKRRVHGDFQFISVGRLDRNKNQKSIIEAFCEEFKKEQHVKLLIIGDGPLYKEYQQLIRLKDTYGKVSLKGRCARKEVAKSLAESDCFVLTSLKETFGVSYIEALGVGLPIIGSNNGGAKDIITIENGLIVNGQDLEQIKSAMRNIYENYWKYDSKEIKRDCEERFGRITFKNRMIQIYNKVIEEEKNASN